MSSSYKVETKNRTELTHITSLQPTH